MNTSPENIWICPDGGVLTQPQGSLLCTFTTQQGLPGQSRAYIAQSSSSFHRKVRYWYSGGSLAEFRNIIYFLWNCCKNLDFACHFISNIPPSKKTRTATDTDTRVLVTHKRRDVKPMFISLLMFVHHRRRLGRGGGRYWSDTYDNVYIYINCDVHNLDDTIFY